MPKINKNIKHTHVYGSPWGPVSMAYVDGYSIGPGTEPYKSYMPGGWLSTWDGYYDSSKPPEWIKPYLCYYFDEDDPETERGYDYSFLASKLLNIAQPESDKKYVKLKKQLENYYNQHGKKKFDDYVAKLKNNLNKKEFRDNAQTKTS